MQHAATVTRPAAAAALRPQASGCRRAPAAPSAQLWAPSSQRQQARQLAAQRQVQRRGGSGGVRRLAVSANTLTYGAEWATPKDAYLTVGLSHCFAKNEDGKLVDQFVIEPITANSMECMSVGASTSFLHVFSMRLGEALERKKESFPEEFAIGSFCEEYEIRCDSCARTWMRPHALDNLLDIVPLGQMKSSYNFSLKDKRVLNAEHIVNDDDNVKQDMSIDVYGRKGKDGDEAAAEEPAAAAETEEDDMDALLSV